MFLSVDFILRLWRTANLKEGYIVKKDNLPPVSWRLGRIIEICPFNHPWNYKKSVLNEWTEVYCQLKWMETLLLLYIKSILQKQGFVLQSKIKNNFN